MAPSDKEIADRIRSAVSALNMALNEAHQADLSVDLEYHTGMTIGLRHPRRIYNATIERRVAV